jgi:hypothetical protein
VFLPADPPPYLIESTRRHAALRLATVLGVADEKQLSARLAELKPREKQAFGERFRDHLPFWEGPLARFDVATIGTR